MAQREEREKAKIVAKNRLTRRKIRSISNWSRVITPPQKGGGRRNEQE